ncbi:hypothetical protein OSL33_23325, partial [Escherichia coli]|nr:hypothetical protein [Escherichia coli]
AHDVPLGCAPDEYDDLISGTCSHLPKLSDLTNKKIGRIRRYSLVWADGDILSLLFQIIFT